MKTDRRQFLIGLFGAATVAAAGPIPALLEKLPQRDFEAAARNVLPSVNEVYGNGLGQYAFARVEYLNEAPWFRVSIPTGYHPLRAESDRIGREALASMKASS